MSDDNKTRELQALSESDLLSQLDALQLTQPENTLEKLLQERATAYAKRKDLSDESTQGNLEALIFRLGDERYAIDTLNVLNVRRGGRITRVPGVPPFYRGVVNWRGQIVTVLDLRYFFHMEIVHTVLDTMELILISASGLELALVTEHIEDVSYIPYAAIESLEMQYAQGVTPAQIVVLDLEQLCLDERLMVAGANTHD